MGSYPIIIHGGWIHERLVVYYINHYMDPLSNNQYFNGKEGFFFSLAPAELVKSLMTYVPKKIVVDGGIDDLFRCF